jgi:hypothetical protein
MGCDTQFNRKSEMFSELMSQSKEDLEKVVVHSSQ